MRNESTEGIVASAVVLIIVVIGCAMLSRVDRKDESFESTVFAENESTVTGTIVRGVQSRYNFAGDTCGAKVLFSSTGSHAGAILDHNQDRYAVFECSFPSSSSPLPSSGHGDPSAVGFNAQEHGSPREQAWFVIELCQAIRVDLIEVANFELFASSVREFSAHCSFSPPPKASWVRLGRFTAESVLERQQFAVPQPAWCRYLRFGIHSHWGSERHCTLTSLVVHGNSLVEDIMSSWSASLPLSESPSSVCFDQQRPVPSLPSVSTSFPKRPRTSPLPTASVPSQQQQEDPRAPCEQQQGQDELRKSPQHVFTTLVTRLSAIEGGLKEALNYAEAVANWSLSGHSQVTKSITECQEATAKLAGAIDASEKKSAAAIQSLEFQLASLHAESERHSLMLAQLVIALLAVCFLFVIGVFVFVVVALRHQRKLRRR